MIKVKNRFNLICYLVITAGFVCCSVFLFQSSFVRLAESAIDIVYSAIYFVLALFRFPVSKSIATVNDMPLIKFLPVVGGGGVGGVPNVPSEIIPPTVVELTSIWDRYWVSFSSMDTLEGYIGILFNIMYFILWGILLLFPLVLLLKYKFNKYIKSMNNDYGKESKPLVFFKYIVVKFFAPIKRCIDRFFVYLKERKHLKMVWLLIWLLNFNLITICIEFLAYYLYLSVSVDFSLIYFQIYKLFCDLSIMLNFVPIFVWVFLGLIIFHKLRKKTGIMSLRHMENMNKGFIKSLPLAILFCGSMGTKKTTCLTDVALSLHVIFRTEAFTRILKYELMFPKFPWQLLANDIKNAVKTHKVYHLATCKLFVGERYQRWLDNGKTVKDLYGYDYHRYGISFYDNLIENDIWNVIEVYTQLYFVYAIETSILYSTYGIREDNAFHDLGNFPLWSHDFFVEDKNYAKAYSRHSHILDFDMLRLGKKMIENNKYRNALDFGIIVITEIAKERGNMLTNKHYDYDADKANPLNDKFIDKIKMKRHDAMIDNFCFVSVLTDEQRLSSLNADTSDLCYVVHIEECSNKKISLPMFFERNALELMSDKFGDLYLSKFRFYRGDMTLFMCLLHTFVGYLYKYYLRMTNFFGYYKLTFLTKFGVTEKLNDKDYFLMFKKIYADRFKTDAYNDIFVNKALLSDTGIMDIPYFASTYATLDEFLSENSYFANTLNNYGDD